MNLTRKNTSFARPFWYAEGRLQAIPVYVEAPHNISKQMCSTDALLILHHWFAPASRALARCILDPLEARTYPMHSFQASMDHDPASVLARLGSTSSNEETKQPTGMSSLVQGTLSTVLLKMAQEMCACTGDRPPRTDCVPGRTLTGVNGPVRG